MGLKVFLADSVHGKGGGVGVAVEERVGGDEEVDGRYGGLGQHQAAVAPDALADAGQHFDAWPPIGEADHGNDVERDTLTMDRGRLPGRETIGDGDVAAVGTVDVVHHAAEQRTVGRGVVQAVEGDVKVDHLVDDDIVEFFGREVEVQAEPQSETGGVQEVGEHAPRVVLTLPHKGGGTAQEDGHFRELPVKNLGVELSETLLYVRDVDSHEFVLMVALC
jgi:hypothetical protein